LQRCCCFPQAEGSRCPVAGFFFLFLAGVIAWRVVNFAQAANRTALLSLAALMGLAGLICIVYQRHWFFTMSAAMRVPVYTIIGISLSFALSFACAELLNYASTSGLAASALPQRAQSALVQTPQQIVLLATASVALGFIYGIIFGFSEIGRNVFTLHTLRVSRHGGILFSARPCSCFAAVTTGAAGKRPVRDRERTPSLKNSPFFRLACAEPVYSRGTALPSGRGSCRRGHWLLHRAVAPG